MSDSHIESKGEREEKSMRENAVDQKEIRNYKNKSKQITMKSNISKIEKE